MNQTNNMKTEQSLINWHEKHVDLWKKPWISAEKLAEIRKKFEQIQETHRHSQKLRVS